MTASIKEREQKLCDREYVEDQEIKRKQEEQLNSTGNTGSEENEIEPEERQVIRKD